MVLIMVLYLDDMNWSLKTFIPPLPHKGACTVTSCSSPWSHWAAATLIWVSAIEARSNSLLIALQLYSRNK